MKFAKLKMVAAALAIGFAAQANAAIDNGAGGNGELFFNIWDANGSYTLDLNKSIDAFQADIATAGLLNYTYAADATFVSFMAGVVNTSLLSFNIAATDQQGARRILSTYTPPKSSPTKTNDVMRSAASSITTHLNFVNPQLGAFDSLAVASSSAAWAGKSSFKHNFGGLINFSNAGTLANNDYTSGLSFMRIDASATGVANSVYNQYLDEGQDIKVWVDGANALHIGVAPIPEPETYALLLAGLGMVGFMARRRRAV